MNKEVEVKNGQVIITITCELREYASDPRYIVDYEKDVKNLIPEEYQNNTQIIESPSQPISNLVKDHHSHIGVWKFKILNKNTRKTTRRKPSTKRSNNGIVKDNKK